ncbi:MAG: alpha-L-fucosidase [Kineothrix sp.]|nr:alpha-L-fucosidase [Kineothrix sp.]
MKYLPEMDSIRTHTIPQWYNDCKFGIFIHWGIYSVPAWAYPVGPVGDNPLRRALVRLQSICGMVLQYCPRRLRPCV